MSDFSSLMSTSVLVLPSLQALIDENLVTKDFLEPAYQTSAGLDLYNAGDSLTVNSETKQNLLIPTGIKVMIPKGYVGLIFERSSVVKSPLKVRAGVIDSGYTGEVFVNCIAIGAASITLARGTKLPFQLIVVPFIGFSAIDEKNYTVLTTGSLRGEKAIGSSDGR